MRAEEYLDQVKKLDAIIENKEEEYSRLIELASGMGNFSVSERVQSSRDLHRSENTIAKYIDLEREINSLKKRRSEIIKTIERLPSVEYYIIYKIFVGDYTLKEIAYDYKRSYEWAKKKKRKALRLIQQMIDE